MCEIKEELRQLAIEHRTALKDFNDLSLESITNLETSGGEIFKKVEAKADKMITFLRLFVILILLIFGTPISYLFLEVSAKPNRNEVMYKHKGLYLHNEEAEVFKKAIDKAADGEKVSDEKFANDLQKIREIWIGDINRSGDTKGTE